MRTKLTRAWLKNGGSSPEDLAIIMGMHYPDFIKILSGQQTPTEWQMEAFSKLFEEPVVELFPDEN